MQEKGKQRKSEKKKAQLDKGEGIHNKERNSLKRKRKKKIPKRKRGENGKKKARKKQTAQPTTEQTRKLPAPPTETKSSIQWLIRPFSRICAECRSLLFPNTLLSPHSYGAPPIVTSTADTRFAIASCARSTAPIASLYIFRRFFGFLFT